MLGIATTENSIKFGWEEGVEILRSPYRCVSAGQQFDLTLLYVDTKQE